jgi:hypothetical protein
MLPIGNSIGAIALMSNPIVRERKQVTYYLYRHFGDDETLLYIGVTIQPEDRLMSHRSSPALTAAPVGP